MKTIYVDFKYNGGKREKSKPVVLTVVREYIGGNVQTTSGDVYKAIVSPKHNTNYIAVA